jgi:uncharacterized protein YndB with AHSA1/START domain
MKANDQSNHVLTITRTFAAPRELVFQAWITAESVKNWWGCSAYPASHAEVDARPGGTWHVCLRADDGSQIWLSGKFMEVRRPERLVFTFIRQADPARGVEPVDTTVTLTFTEHAGKTTMQFRQETFTTAELRDSHNTGWTTGFARLDELLAALETTTR